MRVRARGFVTMVVVGLALSACKREPTFDERYEGAQKAIREKARELDRDMTQRARETSQTEASTDAAVEQPPMPKI